MNNSNQYNSEIYVRKADMVKNGIPIFSQEDDYVNNYQEIAKDHVNQITSTQENPFMEEELWVSLEESTRTYIRKHIKKGSRILDVGVGLGRLLEPLTEFERYGVDISLDYLEIAKKRGIDVALSKIEDLPYKPGFFDAIVVCDVLEHVIDLNYCCENILSCLRPGGLLIVRVPFKEDLDVYLRDDLPYHFIHLRSFDRASLRLHFEKIFGLHFVEAETTTPYLQGTPRLKLRLLPEYARNRIAKFAANRPEFAEVQNSFNISEEAFQNWIYDLKKNSNDLFKSIAEDLILGIEINAVFIKPYAEAIWSRNLRIPISQENNNSAFQLDKSLEALGSDLDGLKTRVNHFQNKINEDTARLSSLLDMLSTNLLNKNLDSSKKKKIISDANRSFDIPILDKIVLKLKYVIFRIVKLFKR